MARHVRERLVSATPVFRPILTFYLMALVASGSENGATKTDLRKRAAMIAAGASEGSE
jgi:hypothetical protein